MKYFRTVFRRMFVSIYGGKYVYRAWTYLAQGHIGKIRYSTSWFNILYEELGDGVTCYRRADIYDGVKPDGDLIGCVCCPKNAMLRLLPAEEKMFADLINQSDFRLGENPVLPGRKVIFCSKMGHCGGRKPYVCRTHPIQFHAGLMFFEERDCRLAASTYLLIHRVAVERLRTVVQKFRLLNEELGYRRVVVDPGDVPPD